MGRIARRNMAIQKHGATFDTVEELVAYERALGLVPAAPAARPSRTGGMKLQAPKPSPATLKEREIRRSGAGPRKPASAKQLYTLIGKSIGGLGSYCPAALMAVTGPEEGRHELALREMGLTPERASAVVDAMIDAGVATWYPPKELSRMHAARAILESVGGVSCPVTRNARSNPWPFSSAKKKRKVEIVHGARGRYWAYVDDRLIGDFATEGEASAAAARLAKSNPRDVWPPPGMYAIPGRRPKNELFYGPVQKRAGSSGFLPYAYEQFAKANPGVALVEFDSLIAKEDAKIRQLRKKLDDPRTKAAKRQELMRLLQAAEHAKAVYGRGKAFVLSKANPRIQRVPHGPSQFRLEYPFNGGLAVYDVRVSPTGHAMAQLDRKRSYSYGRQKPVPQIVVRSASDALDQAVALSEEINTIYRSAREGGFHERFGRLSTGTHDAIDELRSRAELLEKLAYALQKRSENVPAWANNNPWPIEVADPIALNAGPFWPDMYPTGIRGYPGVYEIPPAEASKNPRRKRRR